MDNIHGGRVAGKLVQLEAEDVACELRGHDRDDAVHVGFVVEPQCCCVSVLVASGKLHNASLRALGQRQSQTRVRW